MIRPPTSTTRTDTLVPYTTLCLSKPGVGAVGSGHESSHRRDARTPLPGRMAAHGQARPVGVLRTHPRQGWPGGAGDRGDAGRPRAVRRAVPRAAGREDRSEEHTSELQSLMRISYAVFCLKKKKKNTNKNT